MPAADACQGAPAHLQRALMGTSEDDPLPVGGRLIAAHALTMLRLAFQRYAAGVAVVSALVPRLHSRPAAEPARSSRFKIIWSKACLQMGL